MDYPIKIINRRNSLTISEGGVVGQPALIFSLALALWAAPVRAALQCNPTERDLAATDLVARTGAVLERQTEMGNLFFNAPGVELAIYCFSNVEIYISIKMAYPPPAFFRLAASVGAVAINLPETALVATELACQKAAIRQEAAENAEYKRRRREEGLEVYVANYGFADVKVKGGIVSCISDRTAKGMTSFQFVPRP